MTSNAQPPSSLGDNNQNFKYSHMLTFLLSVNGTINKAWTHMYYVGIFVTNLRL